MEIEIGAGTVVSDDMHCGSFTCVAVVEVILFYTVAAIVAAVVVAAAMLVMVSVISSATCSSGRGSLQR